MRMRYIYRTDQNKCWYNLSPRWCLHYIKLIPIIIIITIILILGKNTILFDLVGTS